MRHIGKNDPSRFTLSTDGTRTVNDTDAHTNFEGIIGRRAVAFLIDAFLLALIAPAALLFNILTLGLLSPLLALALGLLPLAYHTLLIATDRGATLGQRAMGLRVVTLNGNRVDLLQAFILTALFYLTLTVTGGLLLLWCLFDDRGRCLHDILSGTLIIRDNGS